MDDIRLDIKEAAQYCQLPLEYFHTQVKHKTGPKYVKPSERRKFFDRADLDAWMATWQRSDAE